MVKQIFLSPQVKRSANISNKYDIYELPHGLQNDLRLTILGNYEISGKSQNFINYSLVPILTPKMKILPILAKNC